MADKKAMTVVLKQETYDALKRRAEVEKRTTAQLARIIIENGVADRSMVKDNG